MRTLSDNYSILSNFFSSLKGTHEIITMCNLALASYLRIKKHSYKASKMPHTVVTLSLHSKANAVRTNQTKTIKYFGSPD